MPNPAPTHSYCEQLIDIITWNIQHGGGQRRVGEVGRAIEAAACDVVVLTEFRNNQSGARLLYELSTQGLTHHLMPDSGAQTNAVCIVSRFPLQPIAIEPPPRDMRHRCLSVVCEDLYIVAVYFPLGVEKARLFEYLHSLNALAALPAILIGDFNTGLHYVDEEGATFKCAEHFYRLQDTGWTDVWRARHPHIRDYSWHSHENRGFRIDHVLASQGLVCRITGVSYDHAVRLKKVSDHSLMRVKVETGEPHVRAIFREAEVHLEAGMVRWPSPGTPESSWAHVKTISSSSTRRDIEREIARIKRNKKYFRVCERCKELVLKGHMFDARLCQSCASETLGVVY